LGSRWRTTASPALATLRSGVRGARAALGEPVAALGEPAAELGRSHERGLGGNEPLDVCGAVTPNGLPHSRGAFFGRTQLGRVEKLDLSFSTGQG
jgi:hypothetical protein